MRPRGKPRRQIANEPPLPPHVRKTPGRVRPSAMPGAARLIRRPLEVIAFLVGPSAEEAMSGYIAEADRCEPGGRQDEPGSTNRPRPTRPSDARYPCGSKGYRGAARADTGRPASTSIEPAGDHGADRGVAMGACQPDGTDCFRHDRPGELWGMG